MSDEYDDERDEDVDDSDLDDDTDVDDSDVDDDRAIAEEIEMDGSVDASNDQPDADELDVDPATQARLADIAASPLSEHAEAYQQIHTELQQALADIDAS